MTQTITIAGRAFTVTPVYAEGHVLNANEAAALNQMRFENLRNNFAGKAKEGADQAAFDEYASTYQFGVRVGGGSRDPIMTEAMNLARDSVKDLLQKSGKKISDYSAKAISAAAEKLVARDPQFMELAKKRVEEMKSAASTEIDGDLMAVLDAANVKTETAAEPAGEAQGEVTDQVAPEASNGKRSRA